ncbi:MAG: hypothetical protein ACXVEF_07450 [Polyangiales bacterium]
MKTMNASWIVSLAIVVGCSATTGAEGDGTGGDINGPASDTQTDKPSINKLPPLEWNPTAPGYPGNLAPGVQYIPPDPSTDGGTEGTDGGTEGTDGGMGGDDGVPPGGDQTPPIDPPAGETTSTDPTVVPGNPTCGDVFNTALELDVTRLKDGTYTSDDGLFSVTLDFEGKNVSYTVNTGSLIGVLVKGGPHANLYSKCLSTGTDLTTPAGEDISHVVFCYAAPG